MLVEQYRTKLTKSIKREEKKLKQSMTRSAYKEIESKASKDRAVDSVYLRNADADWMHEGDGDAIAIRGSIANVLQAEEKGLVPHQAKEALSTGGKLGDAAGVAAKERRNSKDAQKQDGRESRSISRQSSSHSIKSSEW